MYKNTFNEFRTQIRKHQKKMKFNQLRQQHHSVNLLNAAVDKLITIDTRQQNYPAIYQCLREVNHHVMSLSLYTSNDLTSPQSQRLSKLTEQAFKQFLLDMLNRFFFQDKQNLLINQIMMTELMLLLGLIFKEPSILASLFGLPASLYTVSTEQNPLVLKKYQQLSQQIYESFEVFEHCVIYLRNHIQSNISSATYLTLIHSLTTALQFSTENSTLLSHQVLDYFHELLQSNSIEPYLIKLTQSIIDHQQTNNTLSINPKNSIVFYTAIGELLSSYVDYIKTLRHEHSLSSGLTNKIKTFVTVCLQYLSSKREQTGESRLRIICKDEEIQWIKHQRHLTTRLLFSLSILCITHHHSKELSTISIPQNVALTLSIQIIYFLNNHHLSTTIIHDHHHFNHPPQHNIPIINHYSVQQATPQLASFYISTLTNENDQWLNELELLGCLHSLVQGYHIKLDHVYNKSLEQEEKEQQSLNPSPTLNPKSIYTFFHNILQSIATLTGPFYVHRHLFLHSVVNLYTQWLQLPLTTNTNIFPPQFFQQLALLILHQTQLLKTDCLPKDHPQTEYDKTEALLTDIIDELNHHTQQQEILEI